MTAIAGEDRMYPVLLETSILCDEGQGTRQSDL